MRPQSTGEVSPRGCEDRQPEGPPAAGPDDETARACNRALAELLGLDPDSGIHPHQALSLLAEPAVLVDAGRRILYCNARAAELTGFEPDELVGRTCAEGLRFVNCGIVCPLFEEGIVCERHCELTARGGRPVHVVKNARVLRDAAGRIVGGVETLHDVTDLRHMEEQLRERAKQLTTAYGLLEAFVRGIDEAAVALDADRRILCLSDRAAELLGVSPDERGLSLLDLVSDDGAVAAALDEVLAHGGRRELADVALRRRLRAGVRATLRLGAVAEPGGRVLGATVVLVGATVADVPTFYDMVGRSSAMVRLRGAIQRLAHSDATVLITGGSGVGKEMVARALHLAGPRSDRPFHAVNCAALTEPLLESELFGHERGAFTGADHAKPGRLELCGEGTLLWDEIGCLPPRLQAKLLRVLEQREFERVGGTRTLRLRARILAATNADLAALVGAGSFREDLYYRLRVVPLEVPPLGRRSDDVVDLARHFARQLRGLGAAGADDHELLTVAAEQALQAYSWPGNVRELRNAIQYAVALGGGARPIDVFDLPPEVQCAAGAPGECEERRRIADALAEARYNRVKASGQLGMSRTTLWRKMRQYGLG